MSVVQKYVKRKRDTKRKYILWQCTASYTNMFLKPTQLLRMGKLKVVLFEGKKHI